MLISKKSLAEWTHVIMDEVHERDKDMDFLLLLSRKFLTSNSKNVKIILMSATLNQEKLSNYYVWSGFEQATCYSILGSLHHTVQVYYLNDISKGDLKRIKIEEKAALLDECVEKCCQIIFDINKVDKK